MKSNIGEKLYHNGKYTIYVDSVDNDGTEYRIFFRTYGTYSLNNATLISGIHHITLDNHLYSDDMSAKMSAEYNGKIYHSTVQGLGPMYKDGDYFGFYIFGNDTVAIHGNSLVKLTVSNLYENVWNK